MAVGGGEDCVAHGVLLGMCRWRTTRRWRAAAGSKPGPASTSCAALACSPIPAPTTRWVPAFQHTHTCHLVPVNTPRLAGMLRALCSSRLKELVCRAHVCGQKEYVDLLGK